MIRLLHVEPVQLGMDVKQRLKDEGLFVMFGCYQETYALTFLSGCRDVSATLSPLRDAILELCTLARKIVKMLHPFEPSERRARDARAVMTLQR